MVGRNGTTLRNAVAHEGQLTDSAHSQTSHGVAQNDTNTSSHNQATVGIDTQQHTGQTQTGPQGNQDRLNNGNFHEILPP